MQKLLRARANFDAMQGFANPIQLPCRTALLGKYPRVNSLDAIPLQAAVPPSRHLMAPFAPTSIHAQPMTNAQEVHVSEHRAHAPAIQMQTVSCMTMATYVMADQRVLPVNAYSTRQLLSRVPVTMVRAPLVRATQSLAHAQQHRSMAQHVTTAIHVPPTTYVLIITAKEFHSTAMI